MVAQHYEILEKFDELSKLARQDPAAFDAYRQKLIEEFISGAPVERQLNMRRFQWRIDHETRLHKNSLGRCIKLYGMMTERLDYLRRQINCLAHGDVKDNEKCFESSPNTVVPLKMAEIK